ncbi:hypothetical protein GCM10025794_16960 [Massilia kyonggiensis]
MRSVQRSHWNACGSAIALIMLRKTPGTWRNVSAIGRACGVASIRRAKQLDADVKCSGDYSRIVARTASVCRQLWIAEQDVEAAPERAAA